MRQPPKAVRQGFGWYTLPAIPPQRLDLPLTLEPSFEGAVN
jgi:hypothetical protein